MNRRFSHSALLDDALDETSFWKSCYNNPADVLRLSEKALAKLSSESPARAFVLQARGFAFYLVGHLDSAKPLFDEAERIFKRASIQRGIATVNAMRGFLFEREGDMKSAFQSHLKSLGESQPRGDKAAEAFALLGIGNLYGRTGFSEKAARYYRQSLSLSRSIGDFRLEAAAQMGLGIVYLQQGNAADAFACHNESLKRFSELGDRWSEANARQNIGQVYCAQGDFQKGLRWYQSALRLKSEIGDESGVKEIWWNLALIYRELHRPAAERRAFETLLQLDPQRLNKRSRLKILIALGELRLRNQDFKKAFECFEESLDIARQIQDREEEISILFALGEHYLQRRHAQEAERAWLDALELAEKYALLRLAYPISEKLSELYEARGDFAKALFYHKRFEKQKNVVQNEESKKRIEHIETMLELESIRRDAELTKQKAKSLELDVSQKSAELARLATILLEHHQILTSLSEELKTIVSRVSGRKAKDNRLKTLIATIDRHLRSASDLDAYSRAFHQLHPNFFSELSRRYPSLSTTELLVCSLVCLGLSSKEIATVFYASDVKGARFQNIEKHRVRIRKKLGLTRDHQLASFLASLSAPIHTA